MMNDIEHDDDDYRARRMNCISVTAFNPEVIDPEFYDMSDTITKTEIIENQDEQNPCLLKNIIEQKMDIKKITAKLIIYGISTGVAVSLVMIPIVGIYLSFSSMAFFWFAEDCMLKRLNNLLFGEKEKEEEMSLLDRKEVISIQEDIKLAEIDDGDKKSLNLDLNTNKSLYGQEDAEEIEYIIADDSNSKKDSFFLKNIISADVIQNEDTSQDQHFIQDMEVEIQENNFDHNELSYNEVNYNELY